MQHRPFALRSVCTKCPTDIVYTHYVHSTEGPPHRMQDIHTLPQPGWAVTLGSDNRNSLTSCHLLWEWREKFNTAQHGVLRGNPQLGPTHQPCPPAVTPSPIRHLQPVALRNHSEWLYSLLSHVPWPPLGGNKVKASLHFLHSHGNTLIYRCHDFW